MMKKQTRRHFLKGAGAVGVAAVAGGLWRVLHQFTGPRIKQNFIVIVIDTLRPDAMSCYGNPFQVTPHIDAIAAEGVRFDRAISASGWTLPSVATLLTGTWPTIHGALGKGIYQTAMRDEVPIATEVFKKNKFKTLGLANVTLLSPTLQFGRGFDVYDHQHSSDEKIRRADVTIDTALKLIRANTDKSNFVFIHIFDPHINYDPPPGYKTKFTNHRDKPAPPLTKKQCIAMQIADNNNLPTREDIDYVKGVYYGEVNFVDVHVGRLVDGLKKIGLYDQATIVITSDHGEEFWEHGGFEHGHTVFNELTTVPLIMKLPKTVNPIKHVVKAQVRIVDVMPTLFDLADIKKPSSFIGQSLLPFITDQDEKNLIAFSESTVFGSEKKALRAEQYTYIYDLDQTAKQRYWLYDWRVDPSEKHNLVEELPKIARQLNQQMDRFYSPILAQAEKMSRPMVKVMSYEAQKALRSLGYVR